MNENENEINDEKAEDDIISSNINDDEEAEDNIVSSIEVNNEESIEDINEDLSDASEEPSSIQEPDTESESDTESELNDIPSEDVEVIEEPSTEIQLRDIQKNLIEGALYAAGRPLDVEELATKLEISKKIVDELVNELALEYLERISALIIAQVGERFQMQLRPEYTEKVSKFAKGGAIAERYLRTLTVIALKQPILKSLVIKLRGSGAYEHVKYLLDNDLISGIKKGRSVELTTTDKYSEMFGLPKDKIELKKMMISQLGLNQENNST